MTGFLIDECLSPVLVSVAREHGFEASHVTAVGLSGATDRRVLDHALAQDLAVVTANGVDFLRLVARMMDHPGVVLLRPNVSRGPQVVLFTAALRSLEAGRTLRRRVLDVRSETDLAYRDWPPRTVEI